MRLGRLVSDVQCIRAVYFLLCYSPCTPNTEPPITSPTNLKFADETAKIGLISGGDDELSAAKTMLIVDLGLN